MIKILVSKLGAAYGLLLLIFASQLYAQSPEDYVSKHTLDNGLRVFLAAKPEQQKTWLPYCLM